jgi:hypothetical protein
MTTDTTYAIRLGNGRTISPFSDAERAHLDQLIAQYGSLPQVAYANLAAFSEHTSETLTLLADGVEIATARGGLVTQEQR